MNESRIYVPKLLNNVSTWNVIERSQNSLLCSKLRVVDSELTSIASFGFNEIPVLSSIGQSVRLKYSDKKEYELMREAMKDKIDCTFKSNGLKKVSRSRTGKDSDIQPLRWVLQIKCNLGEENKV